jgi:hypothetical protein
MKSYQTFGTVESHGRIVVGGVPFAAGTEVAITIRERAEPQTDTTHLEGVRVRVRDVFEHVRARNTESVGPLRREELYDRKVLR